MNEPYISKNLIASSILIGFFAFALGYLWGHSSTLTPIVIEKCSDSSR